MNQKIPPPDDLLYTVRVLTFSTHLELNTQVFIPNFVLFPYEHVNSLYVSQSLNICVSMQLETSPNTSSQLKESHISVIMLLLQLSMTGVSHTSVQR